MRSREAVGVEDKRIAGSVREGFRRPTIMVLCAILPLSSVGCGAPAEVPLPSQPPTVLIGMREMRFEHPPTLPTGRVVIRAHNAGKIPHRLVVVPLPEDFPPLLQQLKGAERRVIDPQAGIASQPPGATGTFAVDLKSGRYGLICYVLDPDGTTHATKGMASEFHVP